MTVHIDRAHHHPRVYKRFGYWCAHCPRCGFIYSDSSYWRAAFFAALNHSEAFS